MIVIMCANPRLLLTTLLLLSSCNGSSPDRLFKKATANIERGRYAEAIEQLETLTGKQQTYPGAHYYLGIAYNFHGDQPLAMAALETAVAQSPNDPLPHAELGKIYYNRNQLDSAISHFRAWARLDPKNNKPLFQLAGIYLDRKWYDLAYTTFKKITIIDPDNAKARTFMNDLEAKARERALLVNKFGRDRANDIQDASVSDVDFFTRPQDYKGTIIELGSLQYLRKNRFQSSALPEGVSITDHFQIRKKPMRYRSTYRIRFYCAEGRLDRGNFLLSAQ